MSFSVFAFLTVIFSFSFLSLTSVTAEAQPASSTSNAEKIAATAKRRAYPGGRDEQDLTVQLSLPVPSRSADVIVQTTPTNEDEEQSADHD